MYLSTYIHIYIYAYVHLCLNDVRIKYTYICTCKHIRGKTKWGVVCVHVLYIHIQTQIHMHVYM